jgi:hypothetical protein
MEELAEIVEGETLAEGIRVRNPRSMKLFKVVFIRVVYRGG